MSKKSEIKHIYSSNCACNCKTINAITMDSDINLLEIVVVASSLQSHSPGPSHVPTHLSMRDSSKPDLLCSNDDDDDNNNSDNNRKRK